MSDFVLEYYETRDEAATITDCAIRYYMFRPKWTGIASRNYSSLPPHRRLISPACLQGAEGFTGSKTINTASGYQGVVSVSNTGSTSLMEWTPLRAVVTGAPSFFDPGVRLDFIGISGISLADQHGFHSVIFELDCTNAPEDLIGFNGAVPAGYWYGIIQGGYPDKLLYRWDDISSAVSLSDRSAITGIHNRWNIPGCGHYKADNSNAWYTYHPGTTWTELNIRGTKFSGWKCLASANNITGEIINDISLTITDRNNAATITVKENRQMGRRIITGGSPFTGYLEAFVTPSEGEPEFPPTLDIPVGVIAHTINPATGTISATSSGAITVTKTFQLVTYEPSQGRKYVWSGDLDVEGLASNQVAFELDQAVTTDIGGYYTGWVYRWAGIRMQPAAIPYAQGTITGSAWMPGVAFPMTATLAT
jgi:hypothetical protein